MNDTSTQTKCSAHMLHGAGLFTIYLPYIPGRREVHDERRAGAAGFGGLMHGWCLKLRTSMKNKLLAWWFGTCFFVFQMSGIIIPGDFHIFPTYMKTKTIIPDICDIC